MGMYATMGQTIEEAIRYTPGPPQRGVESVGTLPTVAPDGLVYQANLSISPPLEPSNVLRLHWWLKEVARADVVMFNPSRQNGTTLHVIIPQPIPLLRMLAELDIVEEVTEEAYAGGIKTSPGASDKANICCFRLALKTPTFCGIRETMAAKP